MPGCKLVVMFYLFISWKRGDGNRYFYSKRLGDSVDQSLNIMNVLKFIHVHD